MTDPSTPAPADPVDPTPDLSYAEAVDELEEILAQLESSVIDVDLLAERVARGAALVRFCRNRLRSVRVEVDAVVDELISEPGRDGGETSGG
jgi:exodeoxyribonuclease VII small subunit